jgi:hypothetical protein
MTDDTDTTTGQNATGGAVTPTTVRHEEAPSNEPSTTVVQAVAKATGREPTDLPPLYRSVDGDALDDLFGHAGTSSVSVQFRYAGALVTMERTDTVEVRVEPALTPGDR